LVIELNNLLFERYRIEPNPLIEATLDWLPTIPNYEILSPIWGSIKKVYSGLVDNLYDLDDQLKKSKKTRKQRVDVWYPEPYNFIFEFDESQHFNQFRYSTLINYPGYKELPFDFDQYKIMSNTKAMKPGKSGFQKLRSDDPLFPTMYSGEKQDNRIRQRAFRDFLKDIIPTQMGFNFTLRVSYNVTNGKIKDFTNHDIRSFNNHIKKRNLLGKITIK